MGKEKKKLLYWGRYSSIYLACCKENNSRKKGAKIAVHNTSTATATLSPKRVKFFLWNFAFCVVRTTHKKVNQKGTRRTTILLNKNFKALCAALIYSVFKGKEGINNENNRKNLAMMNNNKVHMNIIQYKGRIKNDLVLIIERLFVDQLFKQFRLLFFWS